MNSNINSSHSSKQSSIYLDKRRDSTSFSAGALICRRTEWSSVAFGVISVPSSPLWGHCYSKIFMRYLFVCLRDFRVAVQDRIAGTHQAYDLCEYLNFPEWSPSQGFVFFSGTLHDLDTRGHWWPQGDLTSPSSASALVAARGSPAEG